jgi:hypothetical protein
MHQVIINIKKIYTNWSDTLMLRIEELSLFHYMQITIALYTVVYRYLIG